MRDAKRSFYFGVGDFELWINILYFFFFYMKEENKGKKYRKFYYSKVIGCR